MIKTHPLAATCDRRSSRRRTSARVIVVVGTRPDAIKLAPVIRAISSHPHLEPLVVATAQQRQLLDQVLSLFGIVPDVDLDVMQSQQSLEEITDRVLAGVSAMLRAERPHAVVVQGDTTTALAAALSAFYQRIPVVHVEAGLRSGDPSSPFPEETNRRLTGVLAALHLAPTVGARTNLLREDIPGGRILVTGNTVIDALLSVTRSELPSASQGLGPIKGDHRPIVLLTAHRRESWGPPLRRVCQAMAEVARAEPDALVVVPVHPNPVVHDSLLPPMRSVENIRVIEPLGYASFCHLLQRSHMVVTDSGGIQEEAPTLGKPVLVLRDVTERPEGIQAGTARLVGTETDCVRDGILRLLRDDTAYTAMANAINPYGDGHAAERAADAVSHLLGYGSAPLPFVPAGSTTEADRATVEPSLAQGA